MLVRAGSAVVLVLVNISGFRPVLARGWHGPDRQRAFQVCAAGYRNDTRGVANLVRSDGNRDGNDGRLVYRCVGPRASMRACSYQASQPLPRQAHAQHQSEELAEDGYRSTVQARAICRNQGRGHGRVEHRKNHPTRV
jgi:hypothetical protein